jgi:Two component regulator propeller
VGRADAIRSLLPSLYRPEPDDEGVLPRLLGAVGAALDSADLDATVVLQSHWFRTADAALLDPFFVRTLQLEQQATPPPTDPALRAFPYIRDLASLAAILSLPPWEDPPDVRETVEDFRDRIARIVEVYRGGVGTVAAVRGMIEAALPVDDAAPVERRDRPFSVEEFAPVVRRSLAVGTPGDPPELVGPLMRWTVDSDGLEDAPATVYVDGVAPQDGLVDATASPVIELYRSGGRMPRVGIAYGKTVAPGTTLRLRPAFSSWLAAPTGLTRAVSLPSDDPAPPGADPTAPGPWSKVSKSPKGSVTALLQTGDRFLWVATLDAAAGSLSRYDGRTWSAAVTGLPEVHCLCADGDDLLIGTETGLLRMPLHPEGDFAATPVAALAGTAVVSMLAASDGTRWVGTGKGVVQLGAADAVTPAGVGATDATATPVRGLAEDATGTLHLGTDRGAFQFQTGTGHWFWLWAGSSDDAVPDWRPFDPGAGGDGGFPAEKDPFVPPVRCVHRGPDASLWLGTDRGVARYVDVTVPGGPSTTMLQAFPDLTDGPVTAVAEDARGGVWFCTDRGLLRTDGRDWFHLEGGSWVQLGRVDTTYDTDPPQARGQWRFDRASSAWQRLDPRSRSWTPFAQAQPRTTAEPAVTAVLWTDDVVGDLLEGWNGETFTKATAVNAKDLVVRVKPTEERIVAGGLPAVPRIPPGSSEWRYLSLEPDTVTAPAVLPAWTVEGRLLPPPDDAPAAAPGWFDVTAPPPETDLDESVWAYNPAARVSFEWEARRPLTLLARIGTPASGERVEPAVLDRVWQGIQQVRPAGVQVALAVGEDIVRR